MHSFQFWHITNKSNSTILNDISTYVTKNLIKILVYFYSKDGLRRMIQMAEEMSKKKLSVQLIKKIYESPSGEQLDKNLQLIKEEKGK